MHKHRWWDLRAEAGEEGGAGGGSGAGDGGVEPAKAREFLTAFAPNPDMVKDLPDDQVLAWHGSVNKQLTTHADNAVKSVDWRKSIAGDNADVMKTLERFQSPKALYESYAEFRTKLSKGELRAVSEFPAKGTDEEKAAWRQQNGVPVTPDKYEIKLGDDVQMRDADKGLIEDFTKFAHERNMTSAAVNDAANWFFAGRAKREADAQQAFETAKRDTAATLGGEWGPDYKGNLNKIQGLLDSTIADDEDGKALKQIIANTIAINPAMARHYAQIALQINPTGTMVPGGHETNVTSITDRLKQIDKMRREDRAAYDKDTEISDRQNGEYVRLLAQYQKMTNKNWGDA